MRYFFAAFIFISLMSVNASAQNRALHLTTNPLSILESDINLGLGLRYDVNTKRAISFEAAYILAPGVISNVEAQQISKASGVKIKAGYRFYTTKTVSNGFYLEPNVFHKYVKYLADEIINVDTGDPNTSFSYLNGYFINKNVTGFNFNWGYSGKFGSVSKWGYDVYIGLGIRKKNVKISGLPAYVPAPELSNEDMLNFAFEEGYFPSLPFGFKFTYRL